MGQLWPRLWMLMLIQIHNKEGRVTKMLLLSPSSHCQTQWCQGRVTEKDLDENVMEVWMNHE